MISHVNLNLVVGRSQERHSNHDMRTSVQQRLPVSMDKVVVAGYLGIFLLRIFQELHILRPPTRVCSPTEHEGLGPKP